MTQYSNSASKRDTVPQVRKFTSLNTLTLVNQQGYNAFGVSSFSVSPIPGTSIGATLKSYNDQYEEYRIRRIRVRAQCGRGFTNDRRLKALLVSRVDTNYINSSDTWANVQSIVQSENSTIRTFTERGNVLIADFRPVQFSASYPETVPTLNNPNQWYRLENSPQHTWRGGVAALILPELGIQPNEISMNLILEVEVEFRGRIQSDTQYINTTLFNEERPINENLIARSDDTITQTTQSTQSKDVHNIPE
jgi:hypothetical protein